MLTLDKIVRTIAVSILTTGIACRSAPHLTSASLNRRIDDVFNEWDKPDSPGCALAIIKEGKVIYQRGYGSANLEYGAPITSSTVFNIASVTKQFTAMSVLLLAQQGKLSLDDDIRKYISEVPDFGQVITIRHLVYHTSGLRDFEELLVMAGWREDGDVMTREHMLDIVSHQKELNFNPGEEYRYCNMDYCLLAEIVARVSGKSFREFVEATIFKPLGMNNAHVQDDHHRLVRNRAYSYHPDGRKSFENAPSNGSAVGGGGIYSTIEDLAKWVKNFDQPLVGGPGVVAQMHERGRLNNGHTLRYAFGLFIDQYKGMKLVEHGGGIAGYRSDIIRFPDQKMAVILLANTSAMDPAQLTRRVADIVLAARAPKTLEVQEPNPAPQHMMRISAENLDAYCGVYELMPGAFGTVTREGDHLYAKSGGGPKVELLLETTNTFLIKEDGSRASFERDEHGQVNRLILQMESSNPIYDTSVVIGQRIVPQRGPLRAEELSEFVGDYDSDELGTTYTIIVKNGALFAQHRRLGNVALTQTLVRDQFLGEEWLPFHFAFTRDSQNHVTGFKLSGQRNRNVHFGKRHADLSHNASR